MANLIALQMNSSSSVQDNIDHVRSQLSSMGALSEETLVVLPECFASLGGGDKMLLSLAEDYGHGPIQAFLSELAKDFGIWLVAGTVPLKSQSDKHKFTASCLLFDPLGCCIAEYQKIHLFDVKVSDSMGVYRESDYTQAGNKVCVVETPFGRLGLAVCYDLRFAGLFEAMGEIDVLVLPSAFTQVTGEAHWHPLLQARAIEKQCYVVAAAQTGVHENNRETYGHTSIWSPWGELLCEVRKEIGIAMFPMSKARLSDIKQSIPVSEHNKFRSSFVE
jgi:predicted amidohydrolase